MSPSKPTQATSLPTYEFLDNDAFASITDRRRMQQIYWQEILLRAHWAAMLNLLRHGRWQAGCVASFQPPANFFSFAASLRGLIEGALDAQYSLGAFPMSLADNYGTVQRALRGTLNGALLAPEVEDRLIHFVYARRLDKQEETRVPTSHRALDPRDYRNGLGLQDIHRDRFRELYDDLCGFCHPTAIGLTTFWGTLDNGAVQLKPFDDRSAITRFYERHKEAIQFALSLSVTTSALCLRTMNHFDFSSVHCASVDSWDFADVPAWKKIMNKIRKEKQ
jgi:hypothetical protein